jgi:hypothetical protein
MEEARQAEKAARQDALDAFKLKGHSGRVTFLNAPEGKVLFPNDNDRATVSAASRRTYFDSALKSLTMEGMGKFLRRCEELADVPSEQSLESAATSSSGSGRLNTKEMTVSGTRRDAEFRAGEGARWHVHYDHVKFGKRKGTRRNFDGRTQTDILNALTAIVTAETSLNAGLNAPSYAVCTAWIRTYVK